MNITCMHVIDYKDNKNCYRQSLRKIMRAQHLESSLSKLWPGSMTLTFSVQTLGEGSEGKPATISAPMILAGE